MQEKHKSESNKSESHQFFFNFEETLKKPGGETYNV